MNQSTHDPSDLTADVDLVALLEGPPSWWTTSSTISSQDSETSSEFARSRHSSSGDMKMSYLEKLHAMLEASPPSIVTWTNNGTSFAILDTQQFETVILPEHFQSVKFASFLRQLKLYRFERTRVAYRDTLVMEFRHERFLRHRVDLVMEVKREYRERPSRAKAKHITGDSDLRAIMGTLTSSVKALESDLAETKAILQSMLHEESATP
ncbi:hypothetical protein AeNC1_001039 [Aphanomyces euteiches]|nr:hypothetical protein AeNC1_001039 [Aphanomyces euteiches]